MHKITIDDKLYDDLKSYCSINNLKITEFCKDRQNLKELENRNKNWFDPAYNMVVTMKHLSPLYREFRNGDLDPVWWNLPEHLDEQVDQIVSFLYY